MEQLTGAVGPGQPNNNADVMRVQTLLNQQPGNALAVDGAYGPLTEAAIQAFQTSAGITPDGIVSPGGPTLQALQPAAPAAGVPPLL